MTALDPAGNSIAGLALFSRFAAAAEAAADAAGAIIRPYFRKPIAADQKADNSPVTDADRQAEQAMRDILSRHWPAHGIQGEEAGQHRPDASLQWVLDPIDGTRAFITGRPIFGTLVALLDHGRPVLGLIDQPITGERWIGLADGPTRFRGRLGGIAGTRRCSSLETAELSCTTPDMLGNWHARWQRLANSVRRVSWGGDCYAYGLLALGQIDIIAERDLKIWDWAALVPVIEGAGGRMTDWSGQPLTPLSAGDVVAVGDPTLLPAVLARLADQPP